jgi:hypothetical protein
MLVYQPWTHPPDADVSSLERATAWVLAIAKPSAAKNVLMESAAAAIRRRRSMGEVNIGKFLLLKPVLGMEA